MQLFTKITYNITLFLILTHVQPATAGWLNGYIPAWIATPLSTVYNYLSPFAPATKNDAQLIKTGIQKELTGAQLLLNAAQEDQRDSLSKFHAIDEDLAWLARTAQALDEKQEAQFEKHCKSLIALTEVQEINHSKITDTVVQVEGLKKQQAQALAALQGISATFIESDHNVNQQMVIIKEIAAKSHAQQMAYTNEQYAQRDKDYKQVEGQLSGMNKKVQALQEEIYNCSEQIRADDEEKSLLIAQLQKAHLALEKQRERRKAKTSVRIIEKMAQRSRFEATLGSNI